MNLPFAVDVTEVMPAVLDTGLLSSLCTITSPPEEFDAGGAPVATAAYIPVTGMEDIPCTAPPLMTLDIIRATERRLPETVQANDERHVLLGGYYPAILHYYRAVIDGVEFDIANVEHDSQKQMTRLALERVSL